MENSCFPLLFIDAYDSFSNNIIDLLETELKVRVVKISIDALIDDFSKFAQNFCGIVVGPGPGTAENSQDVGIINKIWDLADEHLLPVLGICLGFQSLVRHYGGSISRLPNPRHGIETTIVSEGDSIFRGLPEFKAIQYHSLQAQLEPPVEDEQLKVLQTEQKGSRSASDLLPLAWDSTVQNASTDPSTGPRRNPEKILMAVRHRAKPFYGVQFHPESICSSMQAHKVVENWWVDAVQWISDNRPQLLKGCVLESYSATIDLKLNSPMHMRKNKVSLGSFDRYHDVSITNERQTGSSQTLQLLHETLDLKNRDVPDVVSILDHDPEDIIVLDSAKRMKDLGMKSIIGFLDQQTLHITYSVGTSVICLRRGVCSWTETLDMYSGSIFEYLKTFLAKQKLSISSLKASASFSGGLVGFIDYEACLETISVSGMTTPTTRPNLHFAFVERSAVIDFDTDTVRIQSIRHSDNAWVKHAANLLGSSDLRIHHDGKTSLSSSLSDCDGFSIEGSMLSSTTSVDGDDLNWKSKFHTESDSLRSSLFPQMRPFLQVCISKPEEIKYCTKIRACQDELRAGNSYELCLTGQNTIERSSHGRPESSWQHYCRLRKINPAPFAAYLRLGTLTALSSSPERFLTWSAPLSYENQSSGEEGTLSRCQFRPIKGTVRKVTKTRDGTVRKVSFEEASAILSTQKEQAENLMIVDLIRHDLSGVVGHGNVSVPTLMSVEEYESVFQLVTVIEGSLFQCNAPSQVDSQQPTDSNKSGIDVLAASLPPGSMTGAPKKRSCELLVGIEGHQPRSIYSGVIGYMDIAGGGDFSVVIRTLFKWDDECNHDEGKETWRVGAGGAITVLSTEQGEWEEMNTKLSSVLGLFKDKE